MVKSIQTKVSDFLGAYERLTDAQFFPIKSPHDDIICVVCGGAYKRANRSKHCKGKRHLRDLSLILDNKVHPYLDWQEITHEEYDQVIEVPEDALEVYPNHLDHLTDNEKCYCLACDDFHDSNFCDIKGKYICRECHRLSKKNVCNVCE